MARAVEHVHAGFQQDFPVVEDDHLVGVLTRHDLMAGLGRYGPEVRVADVMQHDFLTADPREMLSKPPWLGSRTARCQTLPVVQDGRLVGLLTADHLAEVLMIQEASREPRRRRHRPSQSEGQEWPGVPERAELFLLKLLQTTWGQVSNLWKPAPHGKQESSRTAEAKGLIIMDRRARPRSSLCRVPSGLTVHFANLLQSATIDDHGHLVARLKDIGLGCPPEAIHVADLPRQLEVLLDLLAGLRLSS